DLRAKCSQRLVPSVAAVEDPVHPHKFQETSYRLGDPKQLQIPSAAVQLPQTGKDRSQARAINKLHVAHVKSDFGVRGNKWAHFSLEFLRTACIQTLNQQHDNRYVLNVFNA